MKISVLLVIIHFLLTFFDFPKMALRSLKEKVMTLFSFLPFTSVILVSKYKNIGLTGDYSLLVDIFDFPEIVLRSLKDTY